MYVIMDMMMYTPINELQHPPAFMLEEVECEERAYNTELLRQVLTIHEARPIRLELRKKFNTHPVTQLLHDASARAKRIIEATNRRFPEAIDLTPIEYWIVNNFKYGMPDMAFIETLPKEEVERLKNQTGKNKGEYNRKRYDLAKEIVRIWRAVWRISSNLQENPDVRNKHLKLGFLKFYRYNMELNDWGKTKKSEWTTGLPAMYYNRDWYLN
jgi:hypothetical protein